MSTDFITDPHSSIFDAKARARRLTTPDSLAHPPLPPSLTPTHTRRSLAQARTPSGGHCARQQFRQARLVVRQRVGLLQPCDRPHQEDRVGAHVAPTTPSASTWQRSTSWRPRGARRELGWRARYDLAGPRDVREAHAAGRELPDDRLAGRCMIPRVARTTCDHRVPACCTCSLKRRRSQRIYNVRDAYSINEIATRTLRGRSRPCATSARRESSDAPGPRGGWRHQQLPILEGGNAENAPPSSSVRPAGPSRGARRGKGRSSGGRRYSRTRCSGIRH